MNRRPGELHDIGPVTELPEAARPALGEIALLPGDAGLAAAIEAAGGRLGPLGPETKAVIWHDMTSMAGLDQVIRDHPGLSWVQLPLAGVDRARPLFQEFADRDVLWTSGKGAYAEPVAEHALVLALACLRGIPDKARSTSWATDRLGETLFGARVTIFGAGGIAQALIRLLAPFGASVTIVRRSAGELPGADRVLRFEQLDEVLPETDVLILAAAATAETEKVINAARLALLPPTAVLVNVARGALVDQDALVDALASGHLTGAGIDVTTPEPLPAGHPLWSVRGAVVTSHTADTDEQVRQLYAERIRANVRAYTATGAFLGVVDARLGY